MRHFSECNSIQRQHRKTTFENETQGLALYSRTIMQETLFGEKGINFELFVFSRVEQSETIHSPFNTRSIYYKEAQSVLYY